MSDRELVVLVALVISGLAAALLAGHGPWSGSILLPFTERHGLNTGDLPVLAGWAAGMFACGALWRRR